MLWPIYGLVILIFLATLFSFFKKNPIDDDSYFQEITNSFEEAALICNKEGLIIVMNDAFKDKYGGLEGTVHNLLEETEISDIAFGKEQIFSNKINVTVLKLMNRTEKFPDDLFIIIVKEIIHS